MILSCLRFVSLRKKKFKFLRINKFEFLLGLALYYGSFILGLPVLALLAKAKEQSLYRVIDIIKQPVVISAYKVTFFTALIATIINGISALIIAWVLHKYNFFGKGLLDTAIDFPLALPTSVGGLSLMTVYNKQGWMGPICSWLGIKVVFSQLGVLIAMIFVSFPFVVRTIQPVLHGIDEELEEAAFCLGASQWTTFWEIIFPILSPSFLTGIALGFSRSIGEYGSVILISSNIPNKDLVISVLIAQRLEQYDHKGAIIMSTITLVFAFSILLTVNSIQMWRHNLINQ